jgi:hypothetical protein
MLLWRSLAAILSSFVLRFAVALSYAVGFNSMLFLPLYQARAQSPAPIHIDTGKQASPLTTEGITSPARQAGSPALESILRKNAQIAAASGSPVVQQNAGTSSNAEDTNSDYAPAGAVDIGQVDPGTGKLTFNGPIASIGGGTTPAFSLSASYSSTQVYETAINWNYEQVPSEVGLGFSLPSAHLRIARLATGNGIVGVLMPSNGDKSTNATCFDVYVFAQDRGRETWSAIGENSSTSPFFGNYCGNVRLDVSQNVVTVVSGEEQKYHLWYSNNNWQDEDGITSYSGSLSHTESGKNLVVGTQIGDGFAAFYIAGTGTATTKEDTGDQPIYADFLFINESGVQEASIGTAEVVSKSIQINQVMFHDSSLEQWLILAAQNIYSEGSGINLSIPMHVIAQGAETKNFPDYTYDKSLVLNHVLRGTFTNGDGAPLPADQSPIDYARANNGTAANYISLELVPTAHQDREEARITLSSTPYFSDFVSTGMMAGVMNWAVIDSNAATVQSLVCGLSVPTPTGLGAWSSYETEVSDTGSGDNCFYGEDGDFSASEFYSSDDVFAVSRAKGGGYRSTFLPVFDWTNGKIDDDVASDLYAFYATGAGAERVQFTQDPSYALAFGNRYQEPAGRDNQGAGVGYPLSLAASQARVTTTDYQNWNDASLSSAVDINTSALQSDFNTSSSYGGFGANLTTYRQSVKDVSGLSGVNRQAWIASSAGSKAVGSGEVLSGGMFSLNVPVPSSLSPAPGVSGTLARYMQSLLPNYFAGSTVSSPGNFVNTDTYVDLLGQWRFGYDPNSTGAKHAFYDDAGRLRLARTNPDMTDTTSQGFEYRKFDAWGRVIETGVLPTMGVSGAMEAVCKVSAAWGDAGVLIGSAFAVFTGLACFLTDAVLAAWAPAEALALSWCCVLHPETRTPITKKDTARLTRPDFGKSIILAPN